MSKERTNSVADQANNEKKDAVTTGTVDNDSGTPGSGSGNLTRGLIRFVMMILLPAIIIFYGAGKWAESLRYVTTENAYVKSNLLSISADVSGRVIQVNVRENQRVQSGEILFRLDSRDYELDLEGIRADLKNIDREFKSMKAGYSAGLKEIEELTERVAYLRREFQRAKSLAQRGVGTTVKLDEARTNLALARREVDTKRQSVRTILAKLGGSTNNSVKNYPKYQKLAANLRMAQLNLSRTIIRAPANGIVSNVKLRLGEYVKAATPIFSLIEQPEYWIEANLKETQLTHVNVGQRATLVADSYPDTIYNAQVESISPATGAEFALLPPQNASGNWVKVVQRIPVKLIVEEETGKQTLRAGMTVTVEIDTERHRTLGLILSEWLLTSSVHRYLPVAFIEWLGES